MSTTVVTPHIVVSWSSANSVLAPELQAQAGRLADQLNLPLQQHTSDPVYLYELHVSECGLELLAKTDQGKGKSRLFVDFIKGAVGYRLRQGGGLKQAIAKAVGLKTRHDHRTVLDATAGVGRDAFILASLGCSVTLTERSSIIAALLNDGLIRAMKSPTLQDTVKRMQLNRMDAKTFLSNLLPEAYPDVIYLDPMFPTRTKSALTKIDLRLIRDIVGEDCDAESLLQIALEKARTRVVVKRPRGAPPIASSPTPSFVIEGKKNRFDIYLRTPVGIV